MGADEGPATDRDAAATDGGARDGLAGRPIDEAVEAVRERDASRDRATVRATLERVAADGRVTEAAAQDALAHVSKVVSTPETRVEVAEDALPDARETAEPVADLDVVRHRLETFEARLSTVADQVDDLGDELQRLVAAADDPGSLYEVAAGIGELTAAANDAQRTADELTADVEAFERWVRNPSVRADRLAEDAAALEESVEDLAAAVDALEADGGDDAAADDAADRWLRATLRHRLLDLLRADVRAERDALRSWPGRAGDAADAADAETDAGAASEADDGDGATHAERLDEIGARLDDVGDRLDACGRRLDGVAEPAWRRRHDERLSSFDAALSEREPPVDWGAVRATFESHLPGGDERD